MEKGYYLEENENEMGIYIPGGEGYFRYSLRRIVKPFSDGGTHQNQDLWRLHKMYLCRKTQLGFERIYDFPITNSGEWECAFKIVGTPDFHGGFHGYEHQTFFSVKPEDRCLTISQDSRIVLQGTLAEPVAFHQKEYVFKEGVLTLKQRLVWEGDFMLDRAFMTMLPIRRREGDFLITDTALFRGKEYDVSCEGHKTPISSGCQKKTNEVTVFGKQSGITATVTTSFEKRFSIQNTKEYNKVYFYYAAQSPVSAGEEWNTITNYRFLYQSSESDSGKKKG